MYHFLKFYHLTICNGSNFKLFPGTPVVSHGSQNLMGDCNHEEVDTHIVVHVCHDLEGGSQSVLVRTVDTDIIVVAKFHDILAYNHQADIWVAFGMGHHHTCIRINQICSTLRESKSQSLSVCHAFTGCDCTSSFSRIGKLTAGQAWAS